MADESNDYANDYAEKKRAFAFTTTIVPTPGGFLGRGAAGQWRQLSNADGDVNVLVWMLNDDIPDQTEALMVDLIDNIEKAKRDQKKNRAFAGAALARRLSLGFDPRDSAECSPSNGMDEDVSDVVGDTTDNREEE